MVEIKSDEDILRSYWQLIELEEVIPYDEASTEDKKHTCNTWGFAKYAIGVRLKECRAEIYSALPKTIRRLLRKKADK